MARHDKTIQDREKEDGANELEDFLADCGDGTVTVKVTRLDPPHGYCGEFFVTKSTPLTMQQIQKRFGGRVFQLNTRSSNGKIRKQKTVQIDDVPKREGYEILPDGSTERPNDPENQKAKPNEHPLAILAGMGIPPHIMEQLTPWALGYGGIPQKKENREQVDFEAIRQQGLLNMMNMQMKQSIEFQREMMALKREAETQNHPRNPYSDMEMIFKMLREMKGFQSEIGGGETNLATEALQGTMDLVSNGLSEYLALKKLQAQSEISKGTFNQAPRELPTRQAAAPAMQPRAIDAPTDPIQIARQMGAMFRELDPEKQQLALNAFLGESSDLEDLSENLENIENIPEYDTIENGANNPLDTEDMEILNGATNPNEIEADHIQDGEHTRSADADDQADRAGDSGGQPLPTD